MCRRIRPEFDKGNHSFFQNWAKGILLSCTRNCNFGVWLLLLLLLHTVVVKAWLAEFDDFVVTQCEEWARKYCMQPDLRHPHPSWLSLSVCWAVTDFQISWLLRQITNESSARLRGPKMDEEAKKERTSCGLQQIKLISYFNARRGHYKRITIQTHTHTHTHALTLV